MKFIFLITLFSLPQLVHIDYAKAWTQAPPRVERPRPVVVPAPPREPRQPACAESENQNGIYRCRPHIQQQ